MREVKAVAERIAPFDTTVVITGETGTGKELVARAIHRMSPRASLPFVAQNCAALTETLLDSELFGHARGAFTGAESDRQGLFETAGAGTVFLDEIGEMTPSLQARLLRVLQEREIKRVGESRSRKVGARIICATHRELDRLVEEGCFREDLFYRLQAFVLEIPPLRDRVEDISELAAYFLSIFAERHGRRLEGFSSEAESLLRAHPWPGNVRELEHAIERLIVLGNGGGMISAKLVREALELGPAGARPPQGPDRGGRTLAEALEDYERRIILAELEHVGGVITRAARSLGMDRTTLSRRMRRLGITD